MRSINVEIQGEEKTFTSLEEIQQYLENSSKSNAFNAEEIIYYALLDQIAGLSKQSITYKKYFLFLKLMQKKLKLKLAFTQIYKIMKMMKVVKV